MTTKAPISRAKRYAAEPLVGHLQNFMRHGGRHQNHLAQIIQCTGASKLRAKGLTAVDIRDRGLTC